MELTINRPRLFNASCFAIITTAMAFAIRAGVLTQLAQAFQLNAKELGYINQMAFLGFPIAMIFGGPLYNLLGPKRIIWVAFGAHVLGLVLTITATGYWSLLVSTFFVGFGNGTVEAACNPMVTYMFSNDQKVKMLNRLHMWFPGGIVIGSLFSKIMTDAGLDWQWQIGIILIPALLYAFLFSGQSFPDNKAEGMTSTSENLKAMVTPLYIFMLGCMALTAISEFGPEQWIDPIMRNAGANPMIVLALVTGLMAIGRYFAGPLIHRLNSTGVLWASSLLAAIGIYMMSQATGGMVYGSAIVFAIGVCYFWPTMLGFVAENIPKSGAFGLSIMGGMGMFATSLFQPIIGGWLDQEAAVRGLTAETADLATGQATLGHLIVFPLVLIVAFGILYVVRRQGKWARGEENVSVQQSQR